MLERYRRDPFPVGARPGTRWSSRVLLIELIERVVDDGAAIERTQRADLLRFFEFCHAKDAAQVVAEGTARVGLEPRGRGNAVAEGGDEPGKIAVEAAKAGGMVFTERFHPERDGFTNRGGRAGASHGCQLVLRIVDEG